MCDGIPPSSSLRKLEALWEIYCDMADDGRTEWSTLQHIKADIQTGQGGAALELVYFVIG